jgi:hypothetical protein
MSAMVNTAVSLAPRPSPGEHAARQATAASSIEHGAREQLELRVTQVYRREDGEWRLAHRHADPGPDGTAERLRQAMRDRG